MKECNGEQRSGGSESVHIGDCCMFDTEELGGKFLFGT